MKFKTNQDQSNIYSYSQAVKVQSVCLSPPMTALLPGTAKEELDAIIMINDIIHREVIQSSLLTQREAI